MTNPGPIYEPNTDLADIIAQATAAAAKQSVAWGVSWRLVLATVATTDPYSVIVDGDSAPILVVSMLNALPVAEDRVYVLLTPPSGNFIVGEVNPGRLGKGVGIAYNLSNGSTTSATPVAMPGAPAVAITKRYDDTLLHFVFSCTFFATVADAGPAFSAAVPSETIDIQVGRLDVANGSFNTRQQCAGQASAAVAAGTYTFEGYWFRNTGAGTLFVTTDDIWTMSVEEYWP